MSVYIKPVCECGGDLIYNTEHVFKVRRKILKNGKLAKKQTVEMEYGVHSCYGTMYLFCNACMNEYTFDLDKHDRITNLQRVE